MQRECITTICPLCEREVESVIVEDCEGGYKMLRCPLCKLEFAYPLKGPGKEGYERWYKRKAFQMGETDFYVDYASRLSSSRARRLRDYHIKTLRYLGEMQFASCPKLLDAGCAEGSFIKALEELGFQVYGCDIAEKPIEFARRVYRLKNVISSSPQELPEAWKDFDVITSFEVLEHVEKPLQFLQSLYRLLRPGGILFLSVPHYEILSSKRKKRGGEWDRPPEHLTRWPSETLIFSLEKVGFSPAYIKILQAGEWETFLDAVLPTEIENIYWEWWEKKARGKRGNFLEEIAERGIRFGLLPFFIFLKNRYVRYSLVIARK